MYGIDQNLYVLRIDPGVDAVSQVKNMTGVGAKIIQYLFSLALHRLRVGIQQSRPTCWLESRNGVVR